MPTSDFERVVETYHQTVDAFVRGDAAPQKALWSRRDDATLANPLGPPVRGWPSIERAIDAAAAPFRDAEPGRYELISRSVGDEMAYILEIQHARAKVNDENEFRTFALRVTTIFRLEEDAWKVVHRHADPLIEARTVEAISR